MLDFEDGFLPHRWEAVKRHFEELKSKCNPDLIFTHCEQDRHQDHRVVKELTWNTFRNHLVLEYEIPKFDGDLGKPNRVRADRSRRSIEKFGTHRGPIGRSETSTGSDDRLTALMRLRGIEANRPRGYAEAFYGRKLVLF